MLPKRSRANREGAQSYSVRSRTFSSVSMTARPPVWMQKWLMALWKLGMYGATSFCPRYFLHAQQWRQTRHG